MDVLHPDATFPNKEGSLDSYNLIQREVNNWIWGPDTVGWPEGPVTLTPLWADLFYFVFFAKDNWQLKAPCVKCIIWKSAWDKYILDDYSLI